MTADVGRCADKAYEQFYGGLRTGDWQGYRDLLADEVDLVWPYPPSAGAYHGADGRQKILNFLDEFTAEGNRITENEVVLRLVDGDRVVYEDVGHGTVFGRPYTGRHCVVLTMRGDRVTGHHEYTARVADPQNRS